MLCIETQRRDFPMRSSLKLLFVLTCLISLPPSSLIAAETIDVSDNHGGRVVEYSARWSELARQGVNVRIVGPCQSACTVLLGHIPRSRICVTPEASFGFHLAKRADATATLRRAYAADITAWINAHGGLTQDFIWMRAPDTFRYFRKC
jgi:hypothetical protein